MSKDRFNTTIDLILLMLYTVSSIFLCVQILFNDSLTQLNKYVLAFILMLLLIVFIIFVFASKKLIWLIRSFIIILSIIFSSFAYYLFNTKQINYIEENKIETYYRMNLVTLNTNIKSSFDLEENTIGVLMNDRNHLSTFEDKNESFQMTSCSIKEYHTMDKLVKALKENKIQAMILSDQNIAYLNERYPDVGSQLFVLSENKHAVEISHKIKDVDTTQPYTILLSLSDTDQLQYVSSTTHCYILFVDPIINEISYVELPHNLYIPNVAYDSYPDALHNVSYNGIDNLLYSIESMFNVEFDFFIKTNLDSFVNAVDIMQGISFNYEEVINDETILIEETINRDNIEQYLLKHNNDISNLLIGIHNKKEELIGSKLTNILNNFENNSFSNLKTEKLSEIIFTIRIGDWKINELKTNEFYESSQPCISYGVSDKFNVSIVNIEFMQMIHQQFIKINHLEKMNNFEFNLNYINNGSIKLKLSNKLITENNMYWKIDDYFSVLPDSTINPIEVEKWNGSVNFEQPNFDPDGEIYPIE